jgi:aminoglycoside phosphotransferase (APT) family kinase protein
MTIPPSMRALMCETLEQELSVQRGRAVAIRQLRDEGFDCPSSFSVERLHVVLDDGELLGVFFKDLNPMHQCIEARSVRRTPGLQRSRRELWMYREVLDADRLATPRFYGHRWEPSSGRLWLFIEAVGPSRLMDEGDFELWVAAARWLARFHAAMQDADIDRGMLQQYDNAQFRRHAEQLAESPPDVSAEERGLIREALERHAELLDSLDEQPRGIRHGEFFCKNILIRPDVPADQRLAVIDWETAAHGPLYADLTELTAGTWTRDQRSAMWRAYHEQSCHELGREIPWAHFCADVDTMDLAQAIGWLAWWAQGDRFHIVRCMQELRRVMNR